LKSRSIRRGSWKRQEVRKADLVGANLGGADVRGTLQGNLAAIVASNSLLARFLQSRLEALRADYTKNPN
jgi:hypothetical protein